MSTQTHHTPSIVQDAAAVRCKGTSRIGASQNVVMTLGAARLRMANERTSSCLGSKNDYPPEAPHLVVVMLLVACSSCVLIIALALKLLGL